MSAALETLLRQPGIWRAREGRAEAGRSYLSSGYDALDAVLPGRGWPLGALVEIAHVGTGIGELSLVAPAIAAAGRAGRGTVLVAPPHVPYAPELVARGVDLALLLVVYPVAESEALWAVEQGLRSGSCGAVVAWSGQADDRCLRRLQLAAEEGGALGVLFRHEREMSHASPAALRLRLECSGGKTVVRLLKCRGIAPGRVATLARPFRWPANAAPMDIECLSADQARTRSRNVSPPLRAECRLEQGERISGPGAGRCGTPLKPGRQGALALGYEGGRF